MNILRSTRELKGIVFATICVLLMAGCGGEKGEGPVNPPVPGQGGGNKPNPPTGETAVLPAKDFRAAWVPTVWNLDWPQNQTTETGQKALFTHVLSGSPPWRRVLGIAIRALEPFNYRHRRAETLV